MNEDYSVDVSLQFLEDKFYVEVHVPNESISKFSMPKPQHQILLHKKLPTLYKIRELTTNICIICMNYMHILDGHILGSTLAGSRAPNSSIMPSFSSGGQQKEDKILF